MGIFPDFSQYGYQIIEELGRNREGGRITWKAVNNTGEFFVLKQFAFATVGSSWSGFRAYEREILVLQSLKHPSIPPYLGSIETDNGFCLIQEYIHGVNLATNLRSFTLQEIKQIAISLLKILVYLQQQVPPIIHRDIKPENILVDDNLNVYLVDFGLAKIGYQEISLSSSFVGTPGFIPPEQVRQSTTASDLYSLGVTLICLLTGIKSANIQNLTKDDNPYYLEFQPLLPHLSPPFLQWLEKMVEPSLNQRFSYAQAALEAFPHSDISDIQVITPPSSPVENKSTTTIIEAIEAKKSFPYLPLAGVLTVTGITSNLLGKIAVIAIPIEVEIVVTGIGILIVSVTWTWFEFGKTATAIATGVVGAAGGALAGVVTGVETGNQVLLCLTIGTGIGGWLGLSLGVMLDGVIKLLEARGYNKSLGIKIFLLITVLGVILSLIRR